MPYLSALQVCSRRSAIQIHVYLIFYHVLSHRDRTCQDVMQLGHLDPSVAFECVNHDQSSAAVSNALATSPKVSQSADCHFYSRC